MIGQKELFFVLKRIKQIKSNLEIFGGVCVILIGDPSQLPPVQGNALWIDNTSKKIQKPEMDCYCIKVLTNVYF